MRAWPRLNPGQRALSAQAVTHGSFACVQRPSGHSVPCQAGIATVPRVMSHCEYHAVTPSEGWQLTEGCVGWGLLWHIVQPFSKNGVDMADCSHSTELLGVYMSLFWAYSPDLPLLQSQATNLCSCAQLGKPHGRQHEIVKNNSAYCNSAEDCSIHRPCTDSFRLERATCIRIWK